MMTPAKLAGLAFMTALAVGAAVVSVKNSQAILTQADRGETFLPGLAAKINTIDKIEVRQGDAVTRISRTDGKYVDESGFPVRVEAVGNLLTGLSLLTIEERKTDREERYPDLELAAPGSEDGEGQQVMVQAGGDALANVVIGSRDATVGGTRGGIFARRADAPPAYLLRGAVNLPASRSGWFETELYKLADGQLLTAQFDSGDGQPIKLAQSATSKTVVLDNLPAGRSADPAKVQRLATLASGLSFEDVRKASGEPSAIQLTAVGANQRRYVVTPVGEFDPDNAWVRVKVEAQSVKDVAAAKDENAGFDGFEFKLSSYNAEPLAWKLADVLNAPQDSSAAPAPAGMPGAMPGAMPGVMPGGVPGAMPGVPPQNGVAR